MFKTGHNPTLGLGLPTFGNLQRSLKTGKGMDSVRITINCSEINNGVIFEDTGEYVDHLMAVYHKEFMSHIHRHRDYLAAIWCEVPVIPGILWILYARSLANPG